MVNQLPNYNAAFVYDAMKYLQHTAVVEHKDSLSDDIKSSLSSAPLIALPTALSTKSMIQSANATGNVAKSSKNIFQKDSFLSILPHLYLFIHCKIMFFVLLCTKSARSSSPLPLPAVFHILLHTGRDIPADPCIHRFLTYHRPHRSCILAGVCILCTLDSFETL